MMAKFSDPLKLLHGGDSWKLWTLLEPLHYEATFKGSNRLIVVPEGFKTDGATIPSILWPILPATGKYMRAAVIHDYLYSCLRNGTPHEEAPTRKEADFEFRVALKACDVNVFTRWVMWLGVRAFGWVFL